MDRQKVLSKLHTCGKIFSSAAPINTLQLFRGRKEQLDRVISTISTRGKHIILYGDRGVGKTSLANILKDALEDHESVEVIKVSCNEADNYASVWMRMLSEITTIIENTTDKSLSPTIECTLANLIEPNQFLGSGEIKRLLENKCNEAHELILIFDEFDRLASEHRRSFADTIKDLSDSSTNVTVMLIGVSHDVTELIQEHRSIERCLSQIHMPPMADYELKMIIEKGLLQLNMKIQEDTKQLIITLSRGYPYYTHLLCFEAASRAINKHSELITSIDLADAIRAALKNAQDSVKDEYFKAAHGQRKGTKIPIVLLACAMAKTDELGYFRPVDVNPIENDRLADAELAPDCSEYLNKLATDESRGLILERSGTRRKYKYRFRDPLLIPYIIMKGISDKVIDGTLMDKLCGNVKGTKSVSRSLFEAFE